MATAGQAEAEKEEEEQEANNEGGEDDLGDLGDAPAARSKVRVLNRWCEELGVVPRLMRRLLNTAEDIKHVLTQKLKGMKLKE